MGMETPVEIQKMPDYIDQATKSASIYGWGGPFILFFPAPAADIAAPPAVLMQRRACYLNGDPFAGKTAVGLMGVYPSEAAAVEAVLTAPNQGNPDYVIYAFYRGPENFIYPTMVVPDTAPRLLSIFRALVTQESRDADQAANEVIEVYFIAGTLRGLVPKKIPKVASKPGTPVRPPAPPRPAPAATAEAVVAAPKGVLGNTQMLEYIRQVFKNTPLLHRVRAARALSGPQQIKELRQILVEFQNTTKVIVEEVPDGLVRQATKDPKNFASLNSRPGYLQIEKHVFADAAKFAEEVTHELSSYYVGGKARPEAVNGWGANKYLELLVKGAESSIEWLLSPN